MTVSWGYSCHANESAQKADVHRRRYKRYIVESLKRQIVEPNELLPTRQSLVSRLRQWDDQESWQEFFSTYWKLIYGVAIKSGLTDEEAEDVVQETVLSVAKKMDTFKYDPAVCSFKGWLMHVTRLRIIDQLRRRQPGIQATAPRNSDTARTATVERIPDPV